MSTASSPPVQAALDQARLHMQRLIQAPHAEAAAKAAALVALTDLGDVERALSLPPEGIIIQRSTTNDGWETRDDLLHEHRIVPDTWTDEAVAQIAEQYRRQAERFFGVLRARQHHAQGTGEHR